jgi:hypothetical protein
MKWSDGRREKIPMKEKLSLCTEKIKKLNEIEI